MNSDWIIAQASVIGKSHIEEDIPCQDAHLCKYYKEHNFGIAVVSDGAGSAGNSHLGSGKVVELAQSLFYDLVIQNGWFKKLPEEYEWENESQKQFRIVFEQL